MAAAPCRSVPARLAQVSRIAVIAVISLSALLAGGLLVACSKTPAQRLAQARSLAEANDRNAAIITLKSLLQEAPKLGAARLLLGTLMLEGGDAAGALAELTRAQELGLPPAQVAPPLARALLATGAPDKVLAQLGGLGLSDAQAQADLRTTVAHAHAMLRDLPAARASLDQALRASPEHEPALLLLARIEAVNGDTPAGLRRIDALLARQPKSADAWLLKGDMLARSRAPAPEVSQAYQQALALRNTDASAHAALIAVHLGQRDMAAARSQFQAMQKALPNHPQTLIQEGQLAYLSGDLARARELFQTLLRAAPENLLLLQSAAAVELALGAPAQAEVMLNKALAGDPESRQTRRLLARTQLSLGQSAKALALLEPLLGKDSVDTEALTLAAQARLMTGEVAQATQLFERAARIHPDDPKLRTAVALSNLARGRTDGAIAELQAVAGADTGISADLALISAELHRKAYDRALVAVDGLARKQPGKPLAPHLQGQVLLMQYMAQLKAQPQASAAAQATLLAAARAAFEKSVAADATYLPPVAALAGLDLRDKQPAAAQARFDALLKAAPQNSAARLALADLAQRSGASREAVAGQLDDAIKANPADVNPRLALVDHHLATQNPKAALVAAQAALARLPDNLALLARLGQAQLRVGDFRQAVSTYTRLVSLQPKAAAGYVGLAEAQIGSADLPTAAKTLARALEVAPESLPARRLGITLALRQRQPAQALQLAQALQKLAPAQATGWVMEAEVQMAQQRWDAAMPPLRKALALPDPEQAPERMHHVLMRAGKPADADAFAIQWTKDHASDALFLFYLGDMAVAKKDFALAESRYRAVLKLKPAHALAMNNIAWLMVEQNRPGALDFAERAVAAQPNMPALLDTLALAYAANQQVPKAIELQKRTLAMRPEDPFMRFNLARFYVQAGEKRLAKAELDRLALLGDRFAKQGEVAVLLKGLGGR